MLRSDTGRGFGPLTKSFAIFANFFLNAGEYVHEATPVPDAPGQSADN